MGNDLKWMEALCAGWKGRIIQGVFISCGDASSNESSDIEALTNAADERLYEFKQNYHLSIGKERRRQ